MNNLDAFTQSTLSKKFKLNNLYYDFKHPYDIAFLESHKTNEIIEQYNDIEALYLLREKRDNYSIKLIDAMRILYTSDKDQIYRLFQLCNVSYVTPHSNETLFFNAVRFNHIDIVDALIKCNVNVNTSNTSNYSALILACGSQYNRNTIIKLLLNAGANIFYVNNMGFNALYYCIKNNNIEIVILLLKIALITNNGDVINCLQSLINTFNNETTELLNTFMNNLLVQ